MGTPCTTFSAVRRGPPGASARSVGRPPLRPPQDTAHAQRVARCQVRHLLCCQIRRARNALSFAWGG
eukprot:7576835-Lingulodinium_polyedra.AAC.1